MSTYSQDRRRDEGRRASFNNEAFFAAIDAQRQSRGLKWRQVAEEAELSASTLTRLAQGRRPDMESFASLVAWAGLAPQDFIDRSSQSVARPLTQISALLRRDPDLTPEGRAAMEQILKVTYEQFRKPG